VTAVRGDSADVLAPVLAKAIRQGPTLVALDAHWQNAWPLHKELAICADARKAYPGRLIVVVDDLRVPGFPNFQGCDGGGGSVGHPTYGPKSVEGGEAADITAFPELREWPQLWWPGYAGVCAGYAIVSDMELDMSGLTMWRDDA